MHQKHHCSHYLTIGGGLIAKFKMLMFKRSFLTYLGMQNLSLCLFIFAATNCLNIVACYEYIVHGVFQWFPQNKAVWRYVKAEKYLVGLIQIMMCLHSICRWRYIIKRRNTTSVAACEQDLQSNDVLICILRTKLCEATNIETVCVCGNVLKDAVTGAEKN